jgi:tRNA-dihydrouridine synthase A
MFRNITRETLLYSEMVIDGTLLYNAHDLEAFLGHDAIEHPLCLQLGGCDPIKVGEAAYLCEGYAQWQSINLNCGCPSNKAKKAGYGAELMLDPVNTGHIVKEMMRRVTHTEVTVKCRLGVLPGRDSYDELQTFIREVTNAGAKTIIMHARNVVLTGLSPAQNRSIPPLKYDWVHRLVQEWPDVDFVLNGGLKTFSECEEHLGWDEREGKEQPHPVTGCMIGREAYKNPWLFADADRKFFKKKANPNITRRDAMHNYLDHCLDYATFVADMNGKRDAQIAVIEEGEGERGDRGGGRNKMNSNSNSNSNMTGQQQLEQQQMKHRVYSIGDMIKPMHNFFYGCPTGQKQYVFCYTIVLPSFHVMMVSMSLLSIYYCLLATL